MTTFWIELVGAIVAGCTLGAIAVSFLWRHEPDELACIVCGCTDSRACFGGCAWVSTDPPLCSNCSPGWAS